MPLPAPERISLAEYLARECASDTTQEYFNGEICAVAGGLPLHNAPALRVGRQFLAQLDHRRRQLYSSDQRSLIEATGLTTYPDCSVVCGELRIAPGYDHTIVAPDGALRSLLAPHSSLRSQ